MVKRSSAFVNQFSQCMTRGHSFPKAGLRRADDIMFIKKFSQTSVEQFFEYFLDLREQRDRPVVRTFFSFPRFIYWDYFGNFHFIWKDSVFKREATNVCYRGNNVHNDTLHNVHA